MAEAAHLDQEIASGNEISRALPLAGLPIAVKDNICTQGSPTTAGNDSKIYCRGSHLHSHFYNRIFILCFFLLLLILTGSRILSGYCPTYDATAVARLRAAGAIVIG